MNDSKKEIKNKRNASKPKRDAKQAAFLIKFGKHVKRIRESQGYSQDRVYLEGSLSRATMSRIEHGQVDVQIWTLARIADTIGVPLKKLIDFEKV